MKRIVCKRAYAPYPWAIEEARLCECCNTPHWFRTVYKSYSTFEEARRSHPDAKASGEEGL